MNSNPSSHYHLVEKAIIYVAEKFQHQPSLDEIASHVAVSPHHFQRIFTEWAGVSPKKFLQYSTLNFAKKKLKQEKLPLWAVAEESGLSGTGRLHDLLVNFHSMTPAEYRDGGSGILLNYGVFDSLFGKVVVAATPKGVSLVRFLTEGDTPEMIIKDEFPKSELQEATNGYILSVMNWLRGGKREKVPLHVKGTPFQLQVWEALLQIPETGITNYGSLATSLGKQGSSRAVGTAVGSNPVAMLIPCHRVLRSDGGIGGYRWGETRKRAILAWEMASASMEKSN